MSIPPDSPWRGCASSFAPPVGEENRLAAQNLTNNVERVNVAEGPLNEIVYRPGDVDFLRPLIRWDGRPYQEIFEHGFQARPQTDPTNDTYYNLEHFVHNAGATLDPNRIQSHAFVSTTLNYAWHPNPHPDTLPRGGVMEFYRYEIYSPGGIWVAVTLRDRYRHNSEAEVAFVRGIARQYIRSCQRYTFIRDPNSMLLSFYSDNQLIRNRYFIYEALPDQDPEVPPPVYPPIYCPIHTYVDEDGEERDLPVEIYPAGRKKREVSDDNLDTNGVVELPSYINAAFRASSENEAYLFIKNKYVLLNYAPGTTDDKIVNGPHRICDSFLSLIDTPFGEQGIDCAFDTDYDTGFPFYKSKNEAFIFYANLCAYIDYAPGTTDDKILSGPMTIAAMFPFFKDTMFENGIDAAFASSSSHEAYLFRGDKYALINYDSKKLIAIRKITDGFPSLQGTVFSNDIDAAFAAHSKNEAYLFKGELYALINFAPGTTDDYIIGNRIKKILPNWPSLGQILPLKNKGLNFHYHHSQEKDHDPDQHDEL